ncbi:hypothetical protein DL764_009551 [Monosporascus ibericus]|uniref:DAGKc domain-containing protein n=1 Tax=Monosporascus ibericus TaxID=155417 RepID=A0A4Q4SUP0_9PEZI|nr:hypothetical protein DL764_009551 [Monosporascus ibericus]
MTATCMESNIGSIKTEEVVFIRKRIESSGGYDVFSLQEFVEDGRRPFALTRAQVADVAPDVLKGLLVEQIPEYLRGGPSRKVHVLVSTGAGTGRALAFYEAALQPLLDTLGFASSEGGHGPSAQAESDNRGNRYDLVITKDAQSIGQFAQDLNEGGPEQEAIEMDHTVILLSGDGGIVELLNGKARTDSGSRTQIRTPLVAVLPLGTGNALFNSLHKPVKPVGGPTAPSGLVQGLRTLLTGAAAPLPSFEVAFSRGSRLITYTSADGEEADKVKQRADAVSHLRGAIVASYGFHSQVVWESDTPAYRAHGAKRFGMVAQELLRESHAYSAEVEITRPGEERKRVERDGHAYVLATLVSNLEETFTISPASRPLDGRLRLVHFGDVGGERTMDIMMRAYDGGRHVDMRWAGEGGGGPEERVGYDEIAEVRLTTLERDPRWRKVCVDGTIVEIPQGGSMTVTVEEEAHLRILVDRLIVS